MASGGRGQCGGLLRGVPAWAERWLAHDRDVAALRHPAAVPHGCAGSRRPVVERVDGLVDAQCLVWIEAVLFMPASTS